MTPNGPQRLELLQRFESPGAMTGLIMCDNSRNRGALLTAGSALVSGSRSGDSTRHGTSPAGTRSNTSTDGYPDSRSLVRAPLLEYDAREAQHSQLSVSQRGLARMDMRIKNSPLFLREFSLVGVDIPGDVNAAAFPNGNVWATKQVGRMCGRRFGV